MELFHWRNPFVCCWVQSPAGDNKEKTKYPRGCWFLLRATNRTIIYFLPSVICIFVSTSLSSSLKSWRAGSLAAWRPDSWQTVVGGEAFRPISIYNLYKQHRALGMVLFLMTSIFMTWKRRENVRIWRQMDSQDMFGPPVPSEWTLIRKTDAFGFIFSDVIPTNQSRLFSVGRLTGGSIRSTFTNTST